MPRSRVVKPEFWDDEKLSTISRDARLLFIGLWNYSDDYGVVKGHPVWLKNKIFPYDNIKAAEFKRWITELEGVRAILPFEDGGESFYFIRTFLDHQKVNRPSQFRNPPPPDSISECSVSAHGVVSEGSSLRAYARKTETESKTETETDTRRESGASSSDFQTFYSAYPLKKEPKKAKDRWDKLRKSGALPPIQKILDAIEAQRTEKEQLRSAGKFCPEWKHPATWLNAGCWEDVVCDIEPAANPDSRPTPKIATAPKEFLEGYND